MAKSLYTVSEPIDIVTLYEQSFNLSVLFKDGTQRKNITGASFKFEVFDYYAKETFLSITSDSVDNTKKITLESTLGDAVLDLIKIKADFIGTSNKALEPLNYTYRLSYSVDGVDFFALNGKFIVLESMNSYYEDGLVNNSSVVVTFTETTVTVEIGDASEQVELARTLKNLTEGFKNQASTSAANALTSEQHALTSEQNALTSEQNALASAELASEKADLIPQYLGAYNVATNTPALTQTPTTGLPNGSYYEVSVAGNIGFIGNNFTSGTAFSVGDRLSIKGNLYDRLPFNSESITQLNANLAASETAIIKNINSNYNFAGFIKTGSAVTATQFNVYTAIETCTIQSLLLNKGDRLLYNGTTWIKLDSPDFQLALQSEIDRASTLTAQAGTQLDGNAIDTLDSANWKFNELGFANKSGTIKQVFLWANGSGNIPLVIVSVSGTTTTLVKTLGTYVVANGFNTIDINQSIEVGQFVAFGKGTSTAGIRFKTSGFAGNRYTQASGTALVYGAANSYYALGFSIEYSIVKPLDIYRLKTDSYSKSETYNKTEAYSKLESDTKFLESGSKFTSALQSEVDRNYVFTNQYGIQLDGTSNDVIEAGNWKFNELGFSAVSGTIKQVFLWANGSGNIPLVIVSVSGTTTTLVKTLGTYVVANGFNTIDINQSIEVGQFVAFGKGTSTAGIRFKTSGFAGNRYTQASGTALVYGATNSYYALGFSVEYSIAKPLDVYRTKTDSYSKSETYSKSEAYNKTETYSKTESDTKFLEAGAKFTTAIQAEIDRASTLTAQVGTKLDGTSNDTLFGWKFNELGFAAQTGIIKQVFLWANGAGNIPLSVISVSGTTTTLIKTLGTYVVANGFNTIDINQSIEVGQFVAFAGSVSGAAGIRFKVSGFVGNRYVQANSAGTTITYGAANSYYALGFSVEYSIAKPLDIYRLKTDSYTKSETYSKSESDTNYEQKSLTTVFVIVRKNGTVGVDCNFSGNRGIQDAIDSITDASIKKPYEIVVFDGHYKASVSTDYTAGGITTGMVSWIRGKSFVSVRGVGIDRVKISSTLPNDLTSSVYQYHQTVYWHANYGNLSGLTVECSENRYPIHIDMGATGGKNFISNLFHLRVVHKGNSGNATVWGSCHPIGIGTSDGQIIEVSDCILESPTNPFYSHNNKNFEKGSVMRYVRCKGIMTAASNKVAATFESLGSNQKDFGYFEGCSISGCYIIKHQDAPFIPDLQSEQYYNHADYKIFGFANFPFVYDTTLKGYCLLFESLTTGSSSTVRFDETSTAFPLIIKDKNYVTGNDTTDEFGENYYLGYDYRNGDVDISGYANGRLDIGMDAVGINQTKYVKSLGKRLGDCSSVTKSLVVIVNGTPYTIVFNKNYIGAGTTDTVQSTYTNAQIIAEIMAVIGGVCTVSEFSVGCEYFPEFTDYVTNVKTSETILKGMAVYSDNGIIRRALSTDKRIFGISLDNIVSGYQGRILTKGYIRTNQTYRFSTLQESYVAIVKGEELGISATAGKLSKTATIKHFTCFADGIVSFNI